MSDDRKVLYPNPGPQTETADDTYEPDVSIAHDHIKIGDVVLPGAWIERSSVVVQPGHTELFLDGRSVREGSRVTLTFLVGDIHVDEEAFDEVQLQRRLGFTVPGELSQPEGVPGTTGEPIPQGLLDRLLKDFPEMAAVVDSMGVIHPEYLINAAECSAPTGTVHHGHVRTDYPDDLTIDDAAAAAAADTSWDVLRDGS